MHQSSKEGEIEARENLDRENLDSAMNCGMEEREGDPHVLMARPTAEPTSSNNSDVRVFSVGNGSDMFCLMIRLDSATNLTTLLVGSRDDAPSEAWLSYSYLNVIVQTKKFDLTRANSDFVAVIDGFRFRGSTSELASYFAAEENARLTIHACIDGCLLGSCDVDIGALFSPTQTGNEGSFEERSVSGCYDLRGKEIPSSACDVQMPRVGVTITIKHEGVGVRHAPPSQIRQRPQVKMISTIASQTCPKLARSHQDDQDKSIDGTDEEDSPTQKRKEEDNSEHSDAILAAAALAAAQSDLEKKRREWEEWRHREEISWHEKLREREAAAMRALEEQSKAKEKERDDAAESSRREYARLESRLRKALAEVEARERHFQTKEATLEVEYKKKMADLHLQDRIFKEGSKHAAELERAKVAAAVERAASAEKAVATAERRAKQSEEDLEHYRRQQRDSPEAALLQENATLKGELAISETRTQKERAEKNQALFEKEQIRTNVHKLMKALKREKQKTAAYIQKDKEQLRLGYVDQNRSLALSGNREELQRIQNEMLALNRSPPPKEYVGSVAGYAGRAQSLSQERSGPIPIPIPTPVTPPRHPSFSSTRSSPTSVVTHGGSRANGTKLPTPTQPEGRRHNEEFGIPVPRKVASETKVDRLRREREGLIASGAYSSSNPIVLELDRLINA